MPEIPTYSFNSAKTRELADIYGVSSDLKQLIKSMQGSVNPAYSDVSRPLFYAALILYRRSFKTGVRIGLKTDVIAKLNGGLDYHQYIISQADKLAAHSVNSFEKLMTGICVMDNAVCGVMHFATTLATWDEKEVQQYTMFVSIIINHVDLMCETLKKEVLAEAKSMPVSQIIRGGPMQMIVSGPEDAGEPRQIG